jgi:transposase
MGLPFEADGFVDRQQVGRPLPGRHVAEIARRLERGAKELGPTPPRLQNLSSARDEVIADLRDRRPSVDQIIRIGMDTSKHIFQLHGVNAAEEPVLRKKLRRQGMLAFFTNLPPTVVGIVACSGSHRWARLLGALGHEVRMIAPQFVKEVSHPDS